MVNALTKLYMSSFSKIQDNYRCYKYHKPTGCLALTDPVITLVRTASWQPMIILVKLKNYQLTYKKKIEKGKYLN